MAEEFILISKSQYDKFSTEKNEIHKDSVMTQSNEKNEIHKDSVMTQSNGIEGDEINYKLGIGQIDDEGSNSEIQTKKQMLEFSEEINEQEEDNENEDDTDSSIGSTDENVTQYDPCSILEHFEPDDLEYIHPLLGNFLVNGKKLSYNYSNGEIMCNSKYIVNSNIIKLLKMTISGNEAAIGVNAYLHKLAELKVYPTLIKNRHIRKKYLKIIKGHKVNTNDNLKNKQANREDTDVNWSKNNTECIAKNSLQPIFVENLFDNWSSI